MLFNTLISFLLLALTPLFAFAQSEASSSTTTISTTVTSTATSYVTMTGLPPSSTNSANGTITTPAPTQSTVPIQSTAPDSGASAFRVSYGLGAGVLGVVIFGIL